MGTVFTHADGTEVAQRNAGTLSEGVRVTLRPGAALVSMDTPLRGDDGSTETLRTLAEHAGRGAILPGAFARCVRCGTETRYRASDGETPLCGGH